MNLLADLFTSKVELAWFLIPFSILIEFTSSQYRPMLLVFLLHFFISLIENNSINLIMKNYSEEDKSFLEKAVENSNVIYR